MSLNLHLDPIDLDQVRLTRRLSPGQRIQRLLDARAVVVGLIRGRLRRSHPGLSTAALNLKVLEELDRAGRARWRVRQTIDLPASRALEIWCARPEDVIVGKLMAWAEGRSHKHENDIYEMLVFHYLDVDPESTTLDETYVDAQAHLLGAEVTEFWQAIQATARQQAQREK